MAPQTMLPFCTAMLNEQIINKSWKQGNMSVLFVHLQWMPTRRRQASNNFQRSLVGHFRCAAAAVA